MFCRKNQTVKVEQDILELRGFYYSCLPIQIIQADDQTQRKIGSFQFNSKTLQEKKPVLLPALFQGCLWSQNGSSTHLLQKFWVNEDMNLLQLRSSISAAPRYLLCILWVCGSEFPMPWLKA